MDVQNYTPNPEINKNIWLQFSFYRVLVAPVLITLFFGALYLTSENIVAFDFISQIHYWSLGLSVVVVYGWGVRQAAESISSEVLAKTWDSQRLLNIRPLTMAAGKLFGSTIYTWYAFTCLAFYYLWTSLYMDSPWLRVLMCLSGVLGAIMIQAFVASLSVLKINKNRFTTKFDSIYFAALGFACSFVVVNYVAFMIYDKMRPIYWYNWEFSKVTFILCSLLFFCSWSVYGFYRCIRREYLYTNSVLPWCWFVISLMTFCAGFLTLNEIREFSNDFLFVEVDIIGFRLHEAFVVGILLAYFLAFSEARDVVEIKKMVIAFKEKDWYKLKVECPMWLATLVISAITGVTGILVGFRQWDNLSVNTFWVISVLAFVIRDIAALHYFTFKSTKRNPEFLTIAYLILVYLLLPGVLSGLGDGILTLFYPMILSNPLWAVLPPVIQAGIGVYLIRSAVKKQF